MTPRLRGSLALLIFAIAATFAACDNGPGKGIPVYLVPRDYPTPQAAIDAAQPGELVLISPGVYTHTETRFPDPQEFPNGLRAAMFMKEGVVVEGYGDPGEIVLRDTTGADSTYGAAFVGTSNETVMRNLRFEDFHIGVVVRGDAGQVVACNVDGGDAGVWLFRAGEPWVVGNLIQNCRYDGILNQYADAWIAANVVRDCGAGVGVEFPGSPLVEDNFLCRNRLVGTGANFGATPYLRWNVIVRNGFAGAMVAAGADPVVIENDIYENPVGIWIDFYETPLDSTINGTSNFWDTTDLATIAGPLIRDRADTATAGAFVDYLPISPTSWKRLPYSVDDLCAEELGPGGRAALELAIRPAAALRRAGREARPRTLRPRN